MPITSSRVSWLTLAMTGCSLPSVPKFANKSTPWRTRLNSAKVNLRVNLMVARLI